MIRRYESSSYFAFPMLSKGDGRQTSANVDQIARMHHYIGVETSTTWTAANPVTNDYAISSPTRQYIWPGRGIEKPSHYASGDVVAQDDHISAFNFQFQNSAENPVPKRTFGSGLVPAIDTKGSIGVNVFKDKNEMQIFGSVSGDNFPDAEGFFYDAKGNGVSLGDYQHAWYGSPMWSLQGEGNDQLLKFDITVKINKDGTFKSAYFMKDGKQVDLKIYNQKETNFDSKKIPASN
jgi:hypothetical protein